MLRKLLGIAILIVAVIAWMFWRRETRRRSLARAVTEFDHNRARLEEDFRAAANVTGKPRGLVWRSCGFQNGPALARDRANGEIVGLVGVTIGFEAVAGGGMEDVEAVGNLRAATAILTWTGREWTTTGRAVFNLEPCEVLERYRESLELVTA